MRHAAILLVAALAAAGAGCIGSEPLRPGDLDRWSALNADADALGPPVALEVGGQRLPKRWVFRENPSVVWSAISVVRAAERLRGGEPVDEIEILVSPAHATELADLMARGRKALLQMRDVCAMDEEIDAERWADGMATALAGIEGVARTVAAGPAEAARGQEPLGASAAPMLDMLVQYLNQRTGGMLLADVPPDDVHGVRTILVQTFLQVGFAAAGRRPPEGLREAVLAELDAAEAPEAAKTPLAELLAGAMEQAPPASGGSGGLSGPVRSILAYAPKALQAFEMLARQWDRMDHVAFEFHRQGEETVVAATLAVRDGQEVRLEDMVMFQPVLAFRGTSRVAVLPDLDPTGETVVAFEPVVAEAKDDEGEGEGEADEVVGGVEMRFEGLAWGLAKLFALPLADGRLREVRVFVGEPGEADRIINVALVMEATDGEGDPRRVLHFQDVRRRRRVRGPFEIHTVTEREDLVFNYLTPEKRYTFQRVKAAE